MPIEDFDTWGDGSATAVWEEHVIGKCHRAKAHIGTFISGFRNVDPCHTVAQSYIPFFDTSCF